MTLYLVVLSLYQYKRMKLQTALLTALTALIAVSAPAKADTVAARCDFYPVGEDAASVTMPCTFSQRQGYVTIQTEGGGVYEFSPIGDGPGTYVDAEGGMVYRQEGLGDAGLIFRLERESIYVYWDSSQYTEPSHDSYIGFGTLTASDPGARINLRSEATQSSAAIAYGLAGDRVEILQCVTDADTPNSSLSWCQVEFVESQAIGWVRSDFIMFPGDGY